MKVVQHLAIEDVHDRADTVKTMKTEVLNLIDSNAQTKLIIQKEYKKRNIIRGFIIMSKNYTRIVTNLALGREGELISKILAHVIEENLIDLTSNCFIFKTHRFAEIFKKHQSRIGVALNEILKTDLIRLVRKEGWDYIFMFNPEIIQSTNKDTHLLKEKFDGLEVITKLSQVNNKTNSLITKGCTKWED